MIYYNAKKDLLGEFSSDSSGKVAMIRIEDGNVFMSFTFDWEPVGIL